MDWNVSQLMICFALMEDRNRARLGHEVPFWVPEGSFFFITINCKQRYLNQLCSAGVGDAVLAAGKYYHDGLIWFCRLLLLMPDHLHGIIAFPRAPGIQTTVMNYKHYLATHYPVHWQRDFFDHRLRTHHELQEKMEYILLNPVRRGFCHRPEDWPWILRGDDRPPPTLC